ncbi:MAG: DUF2061 domain-containing protein [Deltaproteobacteria bacterium]|nr:DUF2061 domain-containing protein [Deltaproteobacteria bacterium]
MSVDQHWRSVAKAVSYRATGTITTFLISWLVTGALSLALSIGLVDVFSKVAVYYAHERIWNRIRWGRSAAAQPDYEI